MEDPPQHSQPSAYYKDLFDKMEQGYILAEVLFDSNDQPVDICYLESNAAANRMTGVDLTGKRISQLAPNYERHWYEILGRVAKTGVAERHQLSAGPLGVYYQFHALKVGDSQERKIAVIYEDVTERLSAATATKSMLQAVNNTTLIGVSVFAPVRNEDGIITDFKIVLVNKKIERSSGRKDMIGQLYGELFPGIRQMGLFDLMVQTFESGEPGKMEYHYTHEGFDCWYSTMFIKGENILVSTNLDITERVNAEDERFRNYLLLQQSEELAQTGTWDYNLLTGTFTWSDGMYRLFNLEQKTEVQPEVYLQYITDDSREAGERLVTNIKSGATAFEETINLQVNGQIKVVKIKAIAFENSEGRLTRVLGVDMDVTASRLAEEKFRNLEANQHMEILQVTLNTQETERRRISESLHNGLGQLLYGTRLSMNYLTTKLATQNPEKFAEARKQCDGLLTDAIKECRRLSHELMPAVLASFGLNAAITEICKQLEDGVKFQCDISLNEVTLDNYLELAVFRTVQELMVNVIKHAKATLASVEVSYKNKSISIRVSDNGVGMDEARSKTGIGLSSIRMKVDLLKGDLNVQSSPEKGTIVEILLPVHNTNT